MAGFTRTGATPPDPARILVAAARAALLGGEHVLGVAKSRAPIEETTLERSGKATVEADATHARAAVSFDTPYAVRQHEELDYRHDPGRQAKYLESALTGEADTVRAIAAQQLRQALGT